MAEGRSTDRLLDEQLAYYRARAPQYDGVYERSSGPDPGLLSSVDALRASGSVLELACGTGQWTERLLRFANRVVAVDAAPEMVELARRRVGDDERVRFVVADIFSWRPRERFDVVFFGFWLSHVPLERFEAFWDVVDACLAPGGSVLFVDTGPGEASYEEFVADGVARRRLRDAEWQIVKVLHEPSELERQLAQLGWDVSVRPVGEHFFVGSGGRARRGPPAC